MDFDIVSAANEISESESSASSSTATSETTASETTQDAPEQSGQADSVVESADLSPEDIISSLKGEETKTKGPLLNADTLKLINGLGAIRNGTPIEIKDEKQLVEAIQMHGDYTAKTMEHAEFAKKEKAQFETDRAAIKAERESFEKEKAQLSAVDQENQIMASILSKIQRDDPDTFDNIRSLFQSAVEERNALKPFQEQTNQEIKALRDELNQVKKKDEVGVLSGIKQTWETELKTIQGSVGPSLAKIGLKVDWGKVQEVWKADSSNKMTVEQALYAAYGKDIQSLHNSQRKLLATQAKTAKDILSNGTSGGKGKTGDESKGHKVGDYFSILRDAV